MRASATSPRSAPGAAGGTSFEAVFECVDTWMDAASLTAIVVNTDCWAPYPDERHSHGVPVLWLLVDGGAPEPPWGRVARLPEDEV